MATEEEPNDVDTDEVIRDLPINRGYRKSFIQFNLESMKREWGRVYVSENDDTDDEVIHDADSLPFLFIDTGKTACGRVMQPEDKICSLEGDFEICPACIQGLADWDALDPIDKAIMQVISSIWGIVMAWQQRLEYTKRAAELIVDDDGTEFWRGNILRNINLASDAHEVITEATDDFQVIMRRTTRKLARWGFSETPDEIKAAYQHYRDDIVEIEEETKTYDDIISEYVRPWAQAARAARNPEKPATTPVITESREERLARRRAEREEQQRRAAEAGAPVVIHKPRKRNRQLEAAVSAAQAATGDARVAALKALRQVALDSGDDQWASWAKAELRGTRDCSS